MKFQSAELHYCDDDRYESADVTRNEDCWTFGLHIMEGGIPKDCKFRFHSFMNHCGMLCIKVEIDE